MSGTSPRHPAALWVCRVFSTFPRLTLAILLLGFLPVLFVPVWMNGGTYPGWQGSFVPLSLWAWFCYGLAPANAEFPSRKVRLKTLLRAPDVWAALLFMVFLGIQTWNSDRMRVFDFDAGRWGYSPPRHPRLPWSFSQEESMEMIRWFAPVFTVFLMYRYAAPLRSSPKTVFFIILNSVLAALLGLVHQFASWNLMYDFWGMGEVWGIARDSGPDTFGSFGYPNNAATFYFLLFSFALGLFLRELLRDSAERRPLVVFAGGLLSLLFFFTAQFSVSRSGILGVWLIFLMNVLILGIVGWPRAHPVQRFYAILALCLTAVTLFAGFKLFAQPIHLREWTTATAQLDPGREFSARFFQVESAWAIWRDYPWFGTGGWGYQFLVGFYLAPEYWGLLGMGKANVHNDFFQFLCEFGLVGMTLLFIVFLGPVIRLLRDLRLPVHDDRSLWADPLRFSLSCGLLLMVAHSMIDLPFRSPAVFAHGMLFLLMAAARTDQPSVWTEAVDLEALKPLPQVKGLSRR